MIIGNDREVRIMNTTDTIDISGLELDEFDDAN